MTRDPVCPMCRQLVARNAAFLVEDGEVIHAACHPGLVDAASAIARLLRQRPGHALCAACVGDALSITIREAETGAARLRRTNGFELRVDRCVGCGRRCQVVRALRGSRGGAPSAGAAAQ